MKAKTALAAFGFSLLPVALFLRVVRPWYLRWGASDEEIVRPMLLDDHVPAPKLNTTIGITIDAPPEDVWPWIAQMGDPPRAGYYSYTFIERMVGMDVENSDKFLPEYQTLRAGDVLDRKGSMIVLGVEAGQSLVLGPPASVDWMKCSWAFSLYPTDGNRTRLLTRVRSDWSYRRMLQQSPAYSWPLLLLIEPGAFVMQRKMLKEIKRRAEAHVRRVAASVAGRTQASAPDGLITQGHPAPRN